jgi:hypothetical protein
LILQRVCRSGTEEEAEIVAKIATGTNRVAIPYRLRAAMIRQAHNRTHLGRDKTLDELKRRCWWPGMAADTALWIKKCPVCLEKMKVSTHDAYPVNREAQQAGELLYVDLAGPLKPPSAEGHRYILVCTDGYTKFSMFKPLKTKTAVEVAGTLLREVFMLTGVPQVVYTDQGKEFTASLTQAVFRALGCQFKTALPDLHHSNLAERTIRTLNQLLRSQGATDGRPPAEWPARLPIAAMAMNTTVSKATNFTPYRLFFGREPRLPLDLLLPTPVTTGEPAPTMLRRQVEDFWAVRDGVEDQHRRNQIKLTNLYKPPQEPINRGDLVFHLDSAPVPGVSWRLSPNWSGPHTVFDVVNKNQLVLKDGVTGKTFKTHISRIWKTTWEDVQNAGRRQTARRGKSVSAESESAEGSTICAPGEPESQEAQVEDEIHQRPRSKDMPAMPAIPAVPMPQGQVVVRSDYGGQGGQEEEAMETETAGQLVDRILQWQQEPVPANLDFEDAYSMHQDETAWAELRGSPKKDPINYLDHEDRVRNPKTREQRRQGEENRRKTRQDEVRRMKRPSVPSIWPKVLQPETYAPQGARDGSMSARRDAQPAKLPAIGQKEPEISPTGAQNPDNCAFKKTKGGEIAKKFDKMWGKNSERKSERKTEKEQTKDGFFKRQIYAGSVPKSPKKKMGEIGQKTRTKCTENTRYEIRTEVDVHPDPELRPPCMERDREREETQLEETRERERDGGSLRSAEAPSSRPALSRRLFHDTGYNNTRYSTAEGGNAHPDREIAEGENAHRARSGGENNAINNDPLDIFSCKYSPSEYDKQSLAWRINADFAEEFTGAPDVGAEGGGESVSSNGKSTGENCKLRAAKSLVIPPGGYKWIPVKDIEVEKKTFLLPQVTHGLAQKGLSASQFTRDLAKNVTGLGPMGPAVLLINKSSVQFQARKGQRLGTLVPLQVLPGAPRDGGEPEPPTC